MTKRFVAKPLVPVPVELWAVEKDGQPAMVGSHQQMVAWQKLYGGRLAHLKEVLDRKPEVSKEKAVPKVPKNDDAAVVERINKQKVAEAAEFLDEGVKVGEEMRAGLMHISEEMQEILEGPLTREALLILLQPKIPKLKNGSLMPMKQINDVLDALATLASYLVRR